MNAYVTIDNKYILTRPKLKDGYYLVNVMVNGFVLFTAVHKDERTALGIAVSHVNELVSNSKH